jgi:hypothetical protein
MGDRKGRFFAAPFAAWALALGAVGSASGSALAAKSAAAARDDGQAEITFIGYQTLPGGRGLLFVELSRAVEVEVSRAGSVIEYKLLNARVPLKNNKNPLLLRDFGASALSAVLVPSGPVKKARGATGEERSVRLVVTLRGNASPTHRMVARGKGAALEIELPPAAAGS